MELTNLRRMYSLMKKANMTYSVFPFKRGKVEFDVFFDINAIPFRLGLIVKRANKDIWLNVEQGFRIDPILPRDEYRLLIKILEIQYDENNHFSIKSFFEEFNRKIPLELSPIEEYRDTVIHVAIKDYSIEEAEKIYYLGTTDWDSPANKGKGNRTDKNLEKTRLLYPNIYEQIKDRNISISYTNKKNNKIFYF